MHVFKSTALASGTSSRKEQKSQCNPEVCPFAIRAECHEYALYIHVKSASPGVMEGWPVSICWRDCRSVDIDREQAGANRRPHMMASRGGILNSTPCGARSARYMIT